MRGNGSLEEMKGENLVMSGKSGPSADCPPSCQPAGFLQKNNSLEESARLTHAHGAARNAQSWERAETDFSNMFARDLLPAKNGEEPTLQFLLEVVEILTSYVRKTFDRSTKVLDFHHPHQLLE
ncbi:unnamed protein product, partial [Tetraodon nigroviridis]